MNHCHGSPSPLFQADCGQVGPHDEHDYTADERVCLGSPAAFIEADCGRVGPHGEHRMDEAPEGLS